MARRDYTARMRDENTYMDNNMDSFGLSIHSIYNMGLGMVYKYSGVEINRQGILFNVQYFYTYCTFDGKKMKTGEQEVTISVPLSTLVAWLNSIDGIARCEACYTEDQLEMANNVIRNMVDDLRALSFDVARFCNRG